MTRTEWRDRLTGLVVFRKLLEDEVVHKLVQVLNAAANEENLVPKLADFEWCLFQNTTNWTEYLLSATLDCENSYLRRVASKEVNSFLEECLRQELIFLQELGGVTQEQLLQELCKGLVLNRFDFLPKWETKAVNFTKIYFERVANLSQKGVGVFAKYNVFTLENGALSPVKYPDTQTLSNLPGYEKEREQIVANTKALLCGLPANNVLLYGDAGTGKSSAVKAIANDFAKDGLRLVEVKKNQLYQIPKLVEQLAENPLKFILFIDDLSFSKNDDNFSALKAILEGGVCARSANVVVYATSNRRHLIKELWSDRTGDEVHAGDTSQELLSLAARFGLLVSFFTPEKDRFETILRALIKQYGIEDDPQSILQLAETFAMRMRGRSPRAAKQFIELYKAGVL